MLARVSSPLLCTNFIYISEKVRDQVFAILFDSCVHTVLVSGGCKYETERVVCCDT